jgi:DNA-binding LacI/PurR family transcriptional regulator
MQAMQRRDELAIGVAAGVDYRLVRRVYQGEPKVHPTLAAAVRSAAEKLGYPAPPSGVSTPAGTRTAEARAR